MTINEQRERSRSMYFYYKTSLETLDNSRTCGFVALFIKMRLSSSSLWLLACISITTLKNLKPAVQ